MTKLPLAAAFAAALFFGPASADDPPAALKSIDLDALDYRQSLVFEGVTLALVTGDPAKAGLYTTHATMAAGSRVAPHTHPDPRITVVTDGTMYVGVGEVFDPARLVAYPEGSVFVTPADVPHFMLAKDGATSVLDSGAGPSGVDFIDD